jgi:glycosyltransferase involved in cell wall biosynthesis
MLSELEAEGSDAPSAAADARGLRVAIVSDAAPERNGVGAYYRDLAEHLRGAGVRVDLVAPRFRAGQWYGGLALPLPGDPTQRILLPSPAQVSRRLARLRPDVVVVPTPGPYGMLGLHLARRSGAGLVVGFHTHFERLTGLFREWRLRGPIYNVYLNACHRLLFSRSDLVLANSDAMVAEARRIGARRVGLMGTPIPKRFLDHEPTPPRERLERVLFAGRLAPEKNLEWVVEAARRLPDLEFLVAGDGPLGPWLREQCRTLPNLTQVGWVKRARILAFIDSVDALVLPSRVESFGTIALEAMARARPVLVSSACGILSWELLSRGLFPIREDEHLADALARLRGLDPALRERKARIARRAALEINRRNLDHWLAVLGGDHNRTVDAGR